MMNFDGFLKAVQNLNENSYFYGNEVLYKLAAQSDLQNRDELCGMMWLIGRSYAASPQRRSYGTNKETNWPVRTSNDGRDEFFASIAEKMLEDRDFITESITPLQFAGFDQEEDLLLTVIKAVLRLDLVLSKAIQEFDGAPENITCNGHISFCSKFLHFYFPHSVFIIDTFAQNGATKLYNRGAGAYICDPENEATYCALKMQEDSADHFECDVFDRFSKKDINAAVQKIEQCDEMKEVLQDYESRNQDARHYIVHCVRSYHLGCVLKKNNIEPSEKLAGAEFRSMPRLIDTVFLNIKGKMSEAEKKNQQELEDKRANLKRKEQ